MAREGIVGAENVGLPGGDSGDPMIDALTRPITILVGHFGSGKTEIAVNLALAWRNRGVGVTLVDLDLVKPYFRCRLAKDELEARGIRLVAPVGDLFYADLPMLVPEARTATGDVAGREHRVIFDVGGSDLGARVLGSISGLLDRRTTDLLFVVNANRPFAEDLASLRAMLRKVQTVARLEVTGLVANTHLMQETTPETVLAGIRAARELEAATGIPLRFGAMLADLARAFEGQGGDADHLPILTLERHIVAPFVPQPSGARRRSAVV
jgi:CobQ/CobB/MinD/ParA family nucleotide binding protein